MSTGTLWWSAPDLSREAHDLGAIWLPVVESRQKATRPIGQEEIHLDDISRSLKTEIMSTDRYFSGYLCRFLLLLSEC